ncbi:MAG: molybdopterin-dependent oxidoreductase [Actinomycetota bacterium]
MVRAARRTLAERLLPPDRLRVGPLREGAFTSEVRTRRAGAVLGLALGVTFTVCFVTGVLSHLIQNPPSWFNWPSRPAGLYRITEGLHVATGIASIPLLLGKLWAVYPKLFRWPPVENLAHAIERISLLPLVGGSVFLLFSGVASITRWNPWLFSFPAAHYWAAWITIGALIVHIGAKAGLVRPALAPSNSDAEDPATDGLSRRGFLWTIAGATGAITLFTVGQTVRPLEFAGLLAPRRPTEGPQGFPVNKTARSAGVTDLANDPAYRLSIEGTVRTPLSLSLDDLRAMPQHEATLPIACVDGWSANVRWRGVRVVDLLDMADAPFDADAEVQSLQDQSKAYSSSLLNFDHAHDPDTLLALKCNGERLDIDHGYPLRLIGPNRPGVMQTKWVAKVVV